MGAQSADRARTFRAIYEANYGAIYAYAARRVGAELADEVAADTFLVAWRREAALPPEPLPWLYGIARNMVARQRTAASRRKLTQAALTYERPRPSPVAADADVPGLWEAWGRLSLGDQEVLALVAWEDLPVSEAARVLGCPTSVFSVRLHRARRRMEKLLNRPRVQPVSTTELSEA